MRANRLYTYAQVADLCSVSTRQVRRWVDDGTIRSIVRLSERSPRVPEYELARLQEQATVEHHE